MTVLDNPRPRGLILPGVVERPSLAAESGAGLELPTGFRRERKTRTTSVAPLADWERELLEGLPARDVDQHVAVDEGLIDDEEPARTTVRDYDFDDFDGVELEKAAHDGILREPAGAKRSKLRRPFELIDPNQAWVMWTGVLLLGGILAAALVASFNSVYDMAAWIGMPASIQWLPVVILDVAIVGFSWALMVFSSRLADQQSGAADTTLVREKTARTRIYLVIVTAMSVVANFMHTYDFWGGDLSSPQAIIGVIYSASIPLWALAATEELIRMVFARRKAVHEGITR